jgi:hypothetical protein
MQKGVLLIPLRSDPSVDQPRLPRQERRHALGVLRLHSGDEEG